MFVNFKIVVIKIRKINLKNHIYILQMVGDVRKLPLCYISIWCFCVIIL